MKALKEYIKQTLISVGFNSRNIFDFEQRDKTQLFKNLDSAEFFGGKGTVKKNVEGQSVGLNTDEDSYVTQNQALERSFSQGLRLLMRKETLEDRLNAFLTGLYTQDSPVGIIARLEEQDPVSQVITYYDIVDITEQVGVESRIGAVEVTLTFQIRTGINQRQETLTVDDFPLSGTMIEGG